MINLLGCRFSAGSSSIKSSVFGWHFGVVVMPFVTKPSYTRLRTVRTGMGDHLPAGIPSRYVTKPTRSTQPCIHLSGLNQLFSPGSIQTKTFIATAVVITSLEYNIKLLYNRKPIQMTAYTNEIRLVRLSKYSVHVTMSPARYQHLLWLHARKMCDKHNLQTTLITT